MTVPEGWLAGRHQAVLVTVRADGSPQTSNVAFAWQDGVAKVSVTEDRAKTRNLRRDGRAVLHVLGDTFWQYLSVSVRAEVGPVSAPPGVNSSPSCVTILLQPFSRRETAIASSISETTSTRPSSNCTIGV